MTAIVGVLCREGIVIAADSAATFGIGIGPNLIRTIETPTKKITIIEDRMIVASTGEIGLHQRFCHFVKTLSDQKKFASGRAQVDVATELVHEVLKNFGTTGIQVGHVQLGCLLAFPLGSTLHLCEFQYLTLQPEFKTKNLWFVSMGSGQQITDSFLAFLGKIFCPSSNPGPPSLSDGIFMATWALSRAIECNPGGINGPIQLATLSNGPKGISVKLLTEAEIQDHEANVVAAEGYLGAYRHKLQGDTGKEPKIPDMPKKG